MMWIINVGSCVFVLVYLRVWLNSNRPPKKHKNHKTRAGYLADKRREIEQGLGSGRLLGVVATNALELGAV